AINCIGENDTSHDRFRHHATILDTYECKPGHGLFWFEPLVVKNANYFSTILTRIRQHVMAMSQIRCVLELAFHHYPGEKSFHIGVVNENSEISPNQVMSLESLETRLSNHYAILKEHNHDPHEDLIILCTCSLRIETLYTFAKFSEVGFVLGFTDKFH